VKSIACVVLGLALAAPAAAQSPTPRPPQRPAAPPAPALAIRGFAMATEQSFAAIDTFDATLGKTYGPFFGGGVQLLIHDRFFVEASLSRFQQDGERAYLSGGQAFKLGIPLTATITPFELTGGYRFRLKRHPKVRPYLAAGVGSYSYKETSQFSEAGEDVDTRHVGFAANGGAEFRLQRWVGLAVDVHYTHVPGILGTGGVSQQAGESDLGGVAGRVRFVVGR
jgi:opacity protein-like surface antigen